MNAVVSLRQDNKTAELIESVIIRGDLSGLSPQQRSDYYLRVCDSVGLNPITKPFDFITLNGKLVLYALKSCTEQLRTIHKVSVTELTEADWEGVFMVTAKVQNAEGRTDAAKGAVSIAGLKGEALANAMMKAETKAKRRATLSICGLGLLDEVEVEDIPADAKAPMKTLPKKDARPIYVKLQAEIDAAVSRKALNEWGEANAERIKMMPVDFQDILRLRYQERMLDLRDKESADAAHDDDGVVWEETGERPATVVDMAPVVPAKPPLDHTDVDGTPAFLSRKRQPRQANPGPAQAGLDIRDQRTPPAENAVDPHKWFQEVTTAISTCADLAEIQLVQIMQMMPLKKRIPPEIWKLAEGEIGKRVTKLGEQLIAAE
jgi:hypothetical protein